MCVGAEERVSGEAGERDEKGRRRTLEGAEVPIDVVGEEGVA